MAPVMLSYRPLRHDMQLRSGQSTACAGGGLASVGKWSTLLVFTLANFLSLLLLASVSPEGHTQRIKVALYRSGSFIQ